MSPLLLTIREGMVDLWAALMRFSRPRVTSATGTTACCMRDQGIRRRFTLRCVSSFGAEIQSPGGTGTNGRCLPWTGKSMESPLEPDPSGLPPYPVYAHINAFCP